MPVVLDEFHWVEIEESFKDFERFVDESILEGLYVEYYDDSEISHDLLYSDLEEVGFQLMQLSKFIKNKKKITPTVDLNKGCSDKKKKKLKRLHKALDTTSILIDRIETKEIDEYITDNLYMTSECETLEEQSFELKSLLTDLFEEINEEYFKLMEE
jgi:predicted N-acyltransferase